MSTKTSNAIELPKYKMEVNKRISNNLRFLMNKVGYSQTDLKNVLEQHGLNVNQGNINKYLNKPDKNYISIAMLIKLSEIFNLPMEQLVLEDLNTNYQNNNAQDKIKKNPNSSKFLINNNELSMNSNDRAFRGYFGDYYCYLFPTLSSENVLLTGKLTITKLDKICKVSFTLNTNQINPNSNEEIYKSYEGILVLSKPLHNCYCILKSDELSELSFLIFRHIYLNNANLDCRMSEVLTVSAGDSNYPTVHRMFFSREVIDEKDLPLLLPHLSLNNSDIIIKQSHLNEIQEKYKLPLDAMEHLYQTCVSEPFLIFKEDFLRSLLEQSLPKDEKRRILEYISLIRNKSLSYRYNKVSKKLDANTRRMLIAQGYYLNKKYKKK